MNKFSYIAIMLDGSKVKGVIEAKDLNEARTKIKLKKLQIIDIKENKSSGFFNKSKKRKENKSRYYKSFL